MKLKNNGYATLVTCLLLPVVFLSLGMVAFSLIKTRHSDAVKTSCQENYHDYFSGVRTGIELIESFNPIAINLYYTQQALMPFIWIPAVLKIYQTIYKLRQRLERFQNSTIAILNLKNRLHSIKALAAVQKNLFSENRKVAPTLNHQSATQFRVNPNMQIVKRMKIIFPPYDRSPDIARLQQFSISMRHQLTPLSWMSFFNIRTLNENYTCSATLVTEHDNQLMISYKI